MFGSNVGYEFASISPHPVLFVCVLFFGTILICFAVAGLFNLYCYLVTRRNRI